MKFYSRYRFYRPIHIVLCIIILNSAFGAVLGKSETADKSVPPNDSIQYGGTFVWDAPLVSIPKYTPSSPLEQDYRLARTLFAFARDLERRSELGAYLSGGVQAAKSSENKPDDADSRIVYSKRQKKLLEAKALQTYQRVARLNPSTTVSVRIVEIACLKERYNLANRYVEEMFRLNQPVDKIEPMLLRQLAAGLAELGEIKEAYRLYKPILESMGTRFDPQSVILNFEGAKYAYFAEDYRQASDSFEYVYRAAKDPQEFGLSPRLIDILEIEKAPILRLAADAFLLDGRYDRASHFFEMADKLDEKPAILAYHLARIATAQEQYSQAQNYLLEALKDDISGEEDKPLKLMFDLAEKMNKPDFATQTLAELVNKIEGKINSAQKNAVRLEGKESNTKSRKRLFSQMDVVVWNYYCRNLAQNNKIEESLKRLQKFYDVYPNIGSMNLIIQYELKQRLFASAFDNMARLFKTSGNLESLDDVISKYLADANQKKAFVAAAADIQQKRMQVKDDTGNEIQSGWSIYHASAVGLSLIDVFEGNNLEDETVNPNTVWVQPEESAEIHDIRQFMDYVFSKAKAAPQPESAPSRSASVKNVLSAAQTLFKGAAKNQESAFNGRLVSLLWGMALLRDTQYHTAVQVWQEGLKWSCSETQKSTFYYYISGALALMKQDAQAMEAIEKSLQQTPNNIDFLARKAWLLYLANKLDDSEKLYLQILERFSDKYRSESIRLSLCEARTSLATIYDMRAADPKLDAAAKLEYQNKSEELLEQVLDEYPGDIGALNDLAYFWSERNIYLHRAEKMAQRVTQQAPKNSAYWDTLGWIYFKQKKYDLALETLKHSVSLLEDPTMYDHLGDVYQALNNKQQAQISWKKAIDLLQDKETQKRYPHLKNAVEKKLDGA